ncbi:hypothetical protein O9K63_00815 [Janibacter cremeus]|uniref:hypothetical protein n=1 Tax=Janibacter cremeus TaxID=1285192 RepID=UPI0023F882E2|nr:hypothetical protein [Janibacter cremeus]WEV78366.1 hypothetical protein O9K63_00815 [Janibacter cremeus]
MSRIVRSPISVAVDAAGEPVPVGGSNAQGAGIDGLLDRVGDPVPVRVGTSSWPAEHLLACVVAGVVTDSAAAVAEEEAREVSQLVLVVPDEWRDHRRSALEGAVATLTGLPVVTVGAATGLLGATPGSAGPVLVVGADARLRAHVCIRSDEEWQVQRFGQGDWGAHDVDDALLDFVRDRSSSAQWEEDAVAVRAACRSARTDLARRTATEVELPSGESVRVVRADLELVAGERTGDAVGQLLTDVADADGDDRPTRVLVTGALAALPMLVEVVSSATGEAVEHVTEEDAFERYAATGAAARSATTDDAHEDVDTRNAADTAVLAPASAPTPLRRTSRRRRSVIAVAAALVAATSVAAMTVTDAGEAALLALVEGTVPQSPGSDRSTGDLAGAATLPALPWSGGSDEAENVVDTGALEGAGDGRGSGGDQEESSARSSADEGEDTSSPTQARSGDKDEGKGEGEGQDEEATQSDASSPDSSSNSTSSSSTSSTSNAADRSTTTSPSTAAEPDGAAAPDTADRTSTTPTPTPTPDAPAPTREPTTTDAPQPTSTGSELSEPPASEDPSTSTTAPAAEETSTQSSSTSPTTGSTESETT